MISILAGIVMVVAGLLRYRRTRAQLDEGKFGAGGFIVDLVTILTRYLAWRWAGYLIYVEKSLGRRGPGSKILWPMSKTRTKQEKEVAARASLRFVKDGQVVGLGTGSTAKYFIQLLGEQVKSGLRIRGIPSS